MSLYFYLIELKLNFMKNVNVHVKVVINTQALIFTKDQL